MKTTLILREILESCRTKLFGFLVPYKNEVTSALNRCVESSRRVGVVELFLQEVAQLFEAVWFC
jgi:hypothetical protein